MNTRPEMSPECRVKMLVLGMALLILGCARIQMPPGLPPDSSPPRVEVLRPAPGSTNVPVDADFVLRFDEYVDRTSVRGDLSLNPRPKGSLQLKWRGRQLRIHVTEPLPEGRSWTLELGTGVKDLYGNRLSSPVRIPFATGPVLDTLALRLKLEDRTPSGLAQVWLWPLKDAPKRRFGHAPWRSSPDVSGLVLFSGLAPGVYWALAVEDQNRDDWWDPLRERAALASRRLEVSDGSVDALAAMRLGGGLWMDSLSLEGGQFLDKERVKLSAILNPPQFWDWPDSSRRSFQADSLRLSLLELTDSAGRRSTLEALTPLPDGWMLFLAEPADSLPHVLRFKDGSDSLRLRPPQEAFTLPLVEENESAQAWRGNSLFLKANHAVDVDPERVRLALGKDSLKVRIRRHSATDLELIPSQPLGRIALDEGFLRRGDRFWPDSLRLIPVPQAARSGMTGGAQWTWNRAPGESGWRLVVRVGEQSREQAFALGGRMEELPTGAAVFALYQDRNGSGVWDPGHLRDATPAEPWVALPDTVVILPGWIQSDVILQLPEWLP